MRDGKGKIYLAVLLATIVCLVSAIGIRISPATFLVQDVPVGEFFSITKKYGYIIRISQVPASGYYSLTVKKPSEDGQTATGFEDIPDVNWFYLERETLYISNDSAVTCSIGVNFPDSAPLYNRHFLVGVEIMPIPESVRGNLLLSAELLFRIETEPKAGIKPKISPGEFVFVPSAVDFDSLRPNDTVTVEVKLFSGESTLCHLSRLDPETPVARKTILPTVGYMRIKESMIEFPESVLATPQGASIPISLKLSGKLPRPRLEEVIIAEADSAVVAFLRVRMRRMKNYEMQVIPR